MPQNPSLCEPAGTNPPPTITPQPSKPNLNPSKPNPKLSKTLNWKRSTSAKRRKRFSPWTPNNGPVGGSDPKGRPTQHPKKKHLMPKHRGTPNEGVVDFNNPGVALKTIWGYR